MKQKKNNIYRYEDIQDKSKEGILKELSAGLGKAMFWFETTQGIPHEIFKEWIEGDRLESVTQQLFWYMNFRNLYPQLFNDE